MKIMFHRDCEIMKMKRYLFVTMRFQDNDVVDQLNKLKVYNKSLKAVERRSLMTRFFHLKPRPFE
jgi:hypothetical protein